MDWFNVRRNRLELKWEFRNHILLALAHPGNFQADRLGRKLLRKSFSTSTSTLPYSKSFLSFGPLLLIFVLGCATLSNP